MAASPVTFLHLSDIHFRKGRSEGDFDLDKEIRHAILQDTLALKEQFGIFSGILFSGDIAWGGAKEEYDIASSWLDELCKLLGCKNSQIWLVPGNHDVDRKAILPGVKTIQTALRTAPIGKIDQTVQTHLSDEVTRDLLLRPVKAYLEFAEKYSCVPQDQILHWEDEVALPYGYQLKLRGLNSVLVSNDEDTEGALILSSFQASIRPEPNEIYMTLCHHPPHWLKDRGEVERRLNRHARIQLFGHEHSQYVIRIGDNVRIYAGATHPERAEDEWEPRYNVIQVRVVKSDGKYELKIDTHSRVWNKNHQQFFDDPANFQQSFTLPLSSHSKHQGVEASVTDSERQVDELYNEVKQSVKELELELQPEGNGAFQCEEKGQDIVEAVEILAERFLSFPMPVRLEIAKGLGLLVDEETANPPQNLFALVYLRAKEQKILELLWKRVEEYYRLIDVVEPGENPFQGM